MDENYGFKVFLGGLPSWACADDIRQWFKTDGLQEPNFVRVILDRRTKLSAGFCFIYAKTEADGRAIIERYNGAPIEEKTLRAEVGRFNSVNRMSTEDFRRRQQYGMR